MKQKRYNLIIERDDVNNFLQSLPRQTNISAILRELIYNAYDEGTLHKMANATKEVTKKEEPVKQQVQKIQTANLQVKKPEGFSL